MAGLQHLKSAYGLNQDSGFQPETDLHNSVQTELDPAGNHLPLADTSAYDLTPPIGPPTPFTYPSLADMETGLTDPGSDIRFSAGIGFPAPAMKVNVSTEGAQASVFYIKTMTGDTLGLSGAVNKFGKLSKVLSKAGIDTPNIDFNAEINDIFTPNSITYQQTVKELTDGIGSGIIPTNADAMMDKEKEYRGIVFQVLGNNFYQTPTPYGDAFTFDSDFQDNPIRQSFMDAAIEGAQNTGHTGYIPIAAGSPTFLQQQQIQFGVDDNYPYMGFQDAVFNEVNISYQSPIAGIIPGDIKFKDIQFPKINTNISTKGISEFLDKVAYGSNVILDSITDKAEDVFETIKDNELIQSMAQGIGGAFSNLAGFGKALNFPKVQLPPLDLSGLGNRLGGLADSIGGFLGGLSDNINFSGGHNSPFGGIGGFLGNVIQGGAQMLSNMNPIEELTLPQVQWQNPIESYQKTDYGGEAQFKAGTSLRSHDHSLKPNVPKNLTHTIPIRRAHPFKNNERHPKDVISEVNAVIGGAYSQIGTRYANTTRTSKEGILGKPPSAGYPNASMGGTRIGKTSTKATGDRMTLAPMLAGDDLKVFEVGGKPLQIESAEEGYPFYFKDLRDNTYVILRGMLEAVTDTVTPNWNEELYVGRSEPAYVYGNTTRELSFSMKFIAQSELELDSIYGKLRRIYSMCYPSYNADKQFFSKIRMKAPLVEFRIGELFGNSTQNALGFFTGLTLNIPDETTWEFRAGQRVPKILGADVAMKVIGRETPHKDYPSFLGYIGTTGNADVNKG